MKSPKPNRLAALIGAIGLTLLLAGCKGVPTKGEKEAREQTKAVAADYRPNGQKPKLPTLTTNSSLSDFLTFALLNQPKAAS